ncbi:MAG: hypothetical protein RL026_1690 [Pseudomonadota bacterium]
MSRTTPALDAALLRDGATALGLSLDAGQEAQLLSLASELIRWNQTVNLTAVDQPRDVIIQHLLDSLSVHADITGTKVADVGTGGGFPGLPLAILQPGRRFLLIDSVGRKLRFVAHAARLLGLANVTTLQSRVEDLPPTPQDCVVSRAFAPLPRLLHWVGPLCDPDTRVLAMKGVWPPPPGSPDEGPWPPRWRLASVRRLEVPGLPSQRHLLTLYRDAA